MVKEVREKRNSHQSDYGLSKRTGGREEKARVARGGEKGVYSSQEKKRDCGRNYIFVGGVECTPRKQMEGRMGGRAKSPAMVPTYGRAT